MDGHALNGEDEGFRQCVEPGFCVSGQGGHAPTADLELAVISGRDVQMGLIVATDDMRIRQSAKDVHHLAGPGRADAVVSHQKIAIHLLSGGIRKRQAQGGCVAMDVGNHSVFHAITCQSVCHLMSSGMINAASG